MRVAPRRPHPPYEKRFGNVGWVELLSGETQHGQRWVSPIKRLYASLHFCEKWALLAEPQDGIYEKRFGNLGREELPFGVKIIAFATAP